MTPPRLVELECPSCHGTHWEIDSDFRAARLAGGVDVEYPERDYRCPRCGRTGSGYTVRQKAPPEFFLQPHDMYPMSDKDFQHWVAVLRENFPDHPNLKNIGVEWHPRTKKKWWQFWRR